MTKVQAYAAQSAFLAVAPFGIKQDERDRFVTNKCFSSVQFAEEPRALLVGTARPAALPFMK